MICRWSCLVRVPASTVSVPAVPSLWGVVGVGVWNVGCVVGVAGAGTLLGPEGSGPSRVARGWCLMAPPAWWSVVVPGFLWSRVLGGLPYPQLARPAVLMVVGAGWLCVAGPCARGGPGRMLRTVQWTRASLWLLSF